MMSIIELGGGSHPNFHPNCDCRAVNGVDIVADFEKPLPLPSDTYDFVYSAFALEHITWRKVPHFVSEIYRILKPNGRALIITADLRAQCHYILKKPEWTFAETETIFGSQDYFENSHKSSISQELAERLFKEAGFNNVKITQVGVCGTDMQIQGEKLDDKCDCYNREYYEDGTTGYKMYRDFPVHWRMVELILAQKPESVLELGGARGYITKKLEALGIRATCMDKSFHCWHTRATDSFYLHDALDTPWFGDNDLRNDPSLKGGKFDLCYAASFMEHFREEDLPKLITEMARVCKRGYFTITFEKNPEDHDATHKTFKPIEWWYEKFRSIAPQFNVKIMSPQEAHVLEKTPYQLPSADGLLKLNIGCFQDMYYFGWVNIDELPMEEWAKQRSYTFLRADVREGIKLADNSVDIILASHFLEHLTREEGARFLAECYRTLKRGGVIRLAVPNSLQLAEEYAHGDILHRDINVGVERASDSAEAFFHLLLAGHKTIYDEGSLFNALEKAGFLNALEMKPFESTSKIIKDQTIPMYPTLSLYMEGIKPKVVTVSGIEAIDEPRPTPALAPTHVNTIQNMREISANKITPKSTSTRVADRLKAYLAGEIEEGKDIYSSPDT